MATVSHVFRAINYQLQASPWCLQCPVSLKHAVALPTAYFVARFLPGTGSRHDIRASSRWTRHEGYGCQVPRYPPSYTAGSGSKVSMADGTLSVEAEHLDGCWASVEVAGNVPILRIDEEQYVGTSSASCACMTPCMTPPRPYCLLLGRGTLRGDVSLA